MMAQAEEGLSREDRFIRNRNRRTLAYVAAFGVWQLGEIVREQTSGFVRGLAMAISLGAWAAWTVLLCAGLRDGRIARRDPAIRAALHDERAQVNQLKAYRIGFWAAVGTAALLGIPATGGMLPAFAYTRLVIVAGVGAFLVSSVVLDRDE